RRRAGALPRRAQRPRRPTRLTRPGGCQSTGRACDDADGLPSVVRSGSPSALMYHDDAFGFEWGYPRVWRGSMRAGCYGLPRHGKSRLVILMVAVISALVTSASPALAFRPYTHTATGDAAWVDATDDGQVTVGGRSYPIDPRLRAALQAHRDAYNAGVIGPDAYPDIVMGQSGIHPTDSGRWLRFLLPPPRGA